MKSLAVFILIVVGSISLGLLLDAGHFLWPVVAIIVGAYLIGQLPTLLAKSRNFFSSHRAGPNDKP
jgi:uncharacterized integral membrane protein